MNDRVVLGSEHDRFTERELARLAEAGYEIGWNETGYRVSFDGKIVGMAEISVAVLKANPEKAREAPRMFKIGALCAAWNHELSNGKRAG